ncbi:MAG: methionine synthase [Proteobacteria bacterium]|nr:methionine synthase [Pseudomonadota bacterium]
MNRSVFFDSINVPTPEESIYRRLGYRKGKTQLTPQQKRDIDYYIEDALSFINLKGAGVSISIQEKKLSGIILSTGIIFESVHLSAFLEGCWEIVLMGATAGGDIIEAIREDSAENNLTRAVVFDATASEIVDASLDWIMNYFNQELRRENKRLTPERFSAGYHDFLLENQKIIYDILQLQRIGIKINENFILTPEKSVTAVAGVVQVRKGEY